VASYIFKQSIDPNQSQSGDIEKRDISHNIPEQITMVLEIPTMAVESSINVHNDQMISRMRGCLFGNQSD
jgi:hypothetical protein